MKVITKKVLEESITKYHCEDESVSEAKWEADKSRDNFKVTVWTHAGPGAKPLDSSILRDALATALRKRGIKVAKVIVKGQQE